MIQIIPFNFEPWAVMKINRIIGEMTFMKENMEKYKKLSSAIRKYYTLWSSPNKADDIGNQLCIEVNIVNTHKKKIKEVLSVEDNFGILKYGLAYDLMTF